MLNSIEDLSYNEETGILHREIASFREETKVEFVLLRNDIRQAARSIIRWSFVFSLINVVLIAGMYYLLLKK